MVPISPNIHRLGFPTLRKVLPKQNKNQKASREKQVIFVSLEHGHQISQFAFQFPKCTFCSNSITTQKIAAAPFSHPCVLPKRLQSKILSLRKKYKPLKNFTLRFLSRKRHADGANRSGKLSLNILSVKLSIWYSSL